MIGGGGEIYRLAWPRATRLYITEVDLTPEAEVRFPRDRASLLARDASRARRARAEGRSGFRVRRIRSCVARGREQRSPPVPRLDRRTRGHRRLPENAIAPPPRSGDRGYRRAALYLPGSVSHERDRGAEQPATQGVVAIGFGPARTQPPIGFPREIIGPMSSSASAQPSRPLPSRASMPSSRAPKSEIAVQQPRPAAEHRLFGKAGIARQVRADHVLEAGIARHVLTAGTRREGCFPARHRRDAARRAATTSTLHLKRTASTQASCSARVRALCLM